MCRNFIQKCENVEKIENGQPPSIEITKTSINLRESPQLLFKLNCMNLATSLYLSARGKLPSELLTITCMNTVKTLTVDNIEIYLMMIILMTKESTYPGMMQLDPPTFSLIQILRKFSIYSTTVALLDTMLDQVTESDTTYMFENPNVSKLENIFKNFENAVTSELNRLIWNFTNITEEESQQIMKGTAPNHPSIFSMLSSEGSNSFHSRTPTSVKSTLEKLLVIYCDKYVDNLRHFK